MTPVSKAARALRAIIALALIPSAASAAEGLRAPRVALDLVSEYSAAPVGMPFHVGVRFRLEQGWHIYWKNPGDSGREPRLKWKVPAGATVGPIEWPMPKRFPLPPLANYGFDGEPILPVTVTLASPLRAGAQAKIGLDLDWLVCRVECIPGKGHLDLTLPLTAQDHGQVNAQNQSLIRAALALVPTDAPATVDARFAWADGKFALEARDHGGGAWDRAESVEFFPEDGKLWVHGEEPNAQMGPRSLRIEGRANPERREPPVAVAGVLVFHPAHAGLPPWAYRIQAMPGADPPGRGGLAILLFFAFLGGMLLNLM
ncbi:MAG TPA: protein-disulfide reductase DsbD domain-containing protein, partial [Bdellovibrionota bacterium]|nr:protein-disulfide reductase DsbD domain-containing protein [Bdellovibrionota bacterium]